ncbi:MAG: flagellar basal body rod protein FlgC [bacterium]
MNIRDLFSTFNISAAGLSAQKNQLSVTAENIANATTTRTTEGGAYKRKLLVKKAINSRTHFTRLLNGARLKLATSNVHHISSANNQQTDAVADGESTINSQVVESNNFKQIYDPNHPDANEAGIVEYPDINIVNEMLELISASRMYEANLTMMNATKRLARRSLDI